MKTYANVVCAGMDVHYKFSKVTFRDGDGRIVRRERLEHADRKELRERLSRWPKGLPVVLEASFGWGWISDEVEGCGGEVHLSNCLKVEQMRKARGEAKSNRKDADLLSLLPLEATRWWEVWRPPAEVRDRREWMRFRADLVRIQTQTKNRLHAIFHRHGIFYEFSDLFGTKGRAFLIGLCRDGSPYLSEGALAALRGQVRLLDHVRGELADVTRKLRAILEDDAMTRRLQTIPGIGSVLSHVLKAEIGDLGRFPHQRGLASYSLLAPIADDTGEEDDGGQTPKGRRLGHRGNRTLKWAFIEAAHGAVRKGGRFRALFDRHTQNGKVNRNRGYIKVARELVKIVYAVWRDQRPYSPVAPRPPGPKRPPIRATETRSGTGRLHHPMVVAE